MSPKKQDPLVTPPVMADPLCHICNKNRLNPEDKFNSTCRMESKCAASAMRDRRIIHRRDARSDENLSSDLVIESDRQTQDYLLCSTCEDDLNKGGEMWLLPLLSRYKGPFPFYDLLIRFPPDLVDGDATGYATAKNPEIHSHKLAHFAMRVFWKAAVHSWSGSQTDPMIDLGPYGEPTRRLTRGEAEFPQHMALIIGVLPPPAQLISFHCPYRAQRRSGTTFYSTSPAFNSALRWERRLMRHCGKAVLFATRSIRSSWLIYSTGIPKMISMVWAKARKAKNIEKWLIVEAG